MDFTLYRIKIFLPTQMGIFDGSTVSPTEILREAILERPTALRSLGRRWHIGNTDQLDQDGYYFALGRTARATMPVLDEGSGNFLEAEFESAPYTHAIVDVSIEVCAVAKKPALAATADAIARHLVRVLSSADAVTRRGATVDVSVVNDPGQFLEILRAAYAIRSFTVTFRRPNPFDLNRDFLVPMARLAQETDGDSGSTTIKGQSLTEEPLEELTRSAAATGDNASARVQLHEGHSPVRRSLRGDTATISEPGFESQEQRISVLAKLREKYRSIRGNSA